MENEKKKLDESETGSVSGGGWSDVTDWFKKVGKRVMDPSIIPSPAPGEADAEKPEDAGNVPL